MVQSYNYCHQHKQRQVKCKEKLILVVRKFQRSSFLGLMAQMVKNLPIMQKTWEEALILRCLCPDISDESAVSLAATVSLEKT